ncbi:hypothetical protein RJ641_016416 [Dillenia turbinata]|uniref:Uncharacterized protein n=1 Tax=Dillenia turbinata TaxID=194707 RepID=A0AAN8UPI0_9MAGN
MSTLPFYVWFLLAKDQMMLVKEVFTMDKLRTGVGVEDKESLLTKLKHSVNVVVYLVNLYRIHDKVKELQKAARTLQALCSEAKGLRQMAITRNIPATKRSLEHFLFQVKAILHATSSECTFGWVHCNPDQHITDLITCAPSQRSTRPDWWAISSTLSIKPTFTLAIPAFQTQANDIPAFEPLNPVLRLTLTNSTYPRYLFPPKVLDFIPNKAHHHWPRCL